LKPWVKASIMLLFLSPLVAELLTTATPPWQFVNPVSLAILLSLYGSGALLIREYRARRKLGFTSVLLLGLAYGVLEEGLAVETFFNPEWKDLGEYGVYGRWLGVNWVWSCYLAVFHSLWSIAVPIALVEAFYSEVESKAWLSRRTCTVLVGLISAVTLILNLATPYTASIHLYILCIAVIALLILLARRGSLEEIARTQAPRITPVKYSLYWFFWGLAFFIIFFAAPYTMPHPLIPIAVLALMYWFSLRAIKLLDSGTPIYKYGFASSLIYALAILDVLASLQPGGEYKLFIAIGFIVLVALLGRRIASRKSGNGNGAQSIPRADQTT